MGMFDWLSGVGETFRKPWDQLTGQELAREVQSVMGKQIEFNDLFATKLYQSLDKLDTFQRKLEMGLKNSSEDRAAVSAMIAQAAANREAWGVGLAGFDAKISQLTTRLRLATVTAGIGLLAGIASFILAVIRN